MNDVQGWTYKTKELINLPKYNNVIDSIVKRIFDKGCNVMHKNDKSMHIIQNMIILNTGTEDKLDLIWDLFHEFKMMKK